MPPPDEVAANIRRITNGAMSTPDEVFQEALDDAEGMPDDELTLITRAFQAPKSTHEGTRRIRWSGKFGRAGDLAYRNITTQREHEAFTRAGDVDNDPERFAAEMARHAAEAGPMDSPERINAYFENDNRMRELAEAKARRWEEDDEKLFAEARESMRKTTSSRGRCAIASCVPSSRTVLGGGRFPAEMEVVAPPRACSCFWLMYAHSSASFTWKWPPSLCVAKTCTEQSTCINILRKAELTHHHVGF